MAGAHLAYVNLFARDIEALMRFYADLFGFAERAAFRSPIYRCLDAGGIELGFNAAEAYRLLDLDSAGLPEMQRICRWAVTSRLNLKVRQPWTRPPSNAGAWVAV